MKTKRILLIAISIFGLNALPVWAGDSHNAHHGDKTSAEAPKVAMSDGEIKKIDKEQGKLTIKHGELKNLGMPPMTMNFRVADPAMLQTVTVGQSIQFVAEDINGALTVVKIVKPEAKQ